MEKKNKKVYSILVCILFTILAALRKYTVGNDTQNYIDAFSNILLRFNRYGMDIFFMTRFEKGYTLLMLLIREITSSYTMFFLIVYIFINYSICRFIRKYSDNMCFSFILFFLARCFFSEMNIMRQYIAIAVFLFAIECIEEKKIIKYIILIIFASLFHKSAIFLLPLYFLNRIELNTRQRMTFVVSSLLIYVLLYNILVRILGYIGKYEGYIDSYYNSDKIGNVISFIMSLFIYSFIYMLNLNNKKYDNILQKLLFIELLISFLCIKISILSRITEYFSIISIVLIPNAIHRFQKNNMKVSLTYIVTLLYGIYFFVIAYYRPNWNNCIPYRFFFNK